MVLLCLYCCYVLRWFRKSYSKSNWVKKTLRLQEWSQPMTTWSYSVFSINITYTIKKWKILRKTNYMQLNLGYLKKVTSPNDFAGSDVTSAVGSWNIKHALIVQNLQLCHKCSCENQVLKTIGVTLTWVKFCMIKMCKQALTRK